MSICMVSQSDSAGGAAIAARRIFNALLERQYDVRMLVADRTATLNRIANIEKVDLPSAHTRRAFIDNELWPRAQSRTVVSNTMFTVPYPSYDLTKTKIIQNSDIINLHWTAFVVGPATLRSLRRINKPIVWTLHDQFPFTGGCHYSAGCKGFSSTCSQCPQLTDTLGEMPAAILADQTEAVKDLNLTLIAPSEWMASCVRESTAFHGKRVEVIPNYIDQRTFRPELRAAARRKYGVSDDTIVVTFGAHDTEERRKGAYYLREALEYLSNLVGEPGGSFGALNKTEFWVFGRGNSELSVGSINVRSIGFLDTSDGVARALAASDILLLPSLEDNLPNIMVESLLVGTPVVAFAVGGIGETIRASEGGGAKRGYFWPGPS